MAANIPAVLQLDVKGDGRYGAPHPADDPEGRNIVFSGQLLAQMIMAADHSVESAQDVKSIHTVFSRAGTYEHPMELAMDTTHAGRNWGSTTLTAFQNDRLLSRGLLLMNVHEDDFIRHSPTMPDVPGPDALDADKDSLGFPGTETRTVPAAAATSDGSPLMHYWLKAPESYDSVAVNQGILAWSQPGHLIALAFRPHQDVASITDAHVTLSTGVIAHTTHFHERFDVGDWLLLEWESTYAGHGRVHGCGRAFDRQGRLVSTFEQDSMVRRADRPLDPNKSM